MITFRLSSVRFGLSALVMRIITSSLVNNGLMLIDRFLLKFLMLTSALVLAQNTTIINLSVLASRLIKASLALAIFFGLMSLTF